MLGWIVLLIWYVLYTVNAVTPIFTNTSIFLVHGITGITGTLLVLFGYYYLNETEAHK